MSGETNVKQVVPFFGVDNMTASLAFYVDGIGFRRTNSWTPRGRVEWCSLELGSVAIMLQEYRKDEDHAFRPQGKLGAGVSTVFICEDAIALYKEFHQRGLNPSRPFVGNGMWVTTLFDPDGYRLDFESYTDAPEESEWQE